MKNMKKERILLFEETKIIEEFVSRMRGFASSVEDLRTIQPFESWDGLYEILHTKDFALKELIKRDKDAKKMNELYPTLEVKLPDDLRAIDGDIRLINNELQRYKDYHQFIEIDSDGARVKDLESHLDKWRRYASTAKQLERLGYSNAYKDMANQLPIDKNELRRWINPMVLYTETNGWIVDIGFVLSGNGLGFSEELRDELNQHKSNDGVQ